MSFDIDVPASGLDDTAAMQAAVNRVRATGRFGGRINLDAKDYFLSSTIDCSALTGIEIVGCPNTRINPKFSGTPVYDFTGSSNWLIRQSEIVTSGTYVPTYGIYAQDQDKVVIDRVRCFGAFAMAAVGIVGVDSTTIRDCQFLNSNNLAPALRISNLPGRPTHDLASYNTEYHAGTTSNPYTIMINNSDHITFRDGICDNSLNAHILFQGACNHITLDCVKFYSELGHPSGAVFLCNTGDSLSYMRVVNPFRDGIPIINAGGGVDMSTLRIETP